MEMRRQVTVSWDSGGSDEAPPKVNQETIYISSFFLLAYETLAITNRDLFNFSPAGRVTQALDPAKATSPALNTTTFK